MHDAIAVLCSILYIELLINFRMRDLTAMRKQQTQAGEAKRRKLHRYATIDWGYGHSVGTYVMITQQRWRYIAMATTIYLRRDYTKEGL